MLDGLTSITAVQPDPCQERLRLSCGRSIPRQKETARSLFEHAFVEGCVVDASLYETALTWISGAAASFRLSGEVPKRHPTGSVTLVPFEGFQTATGMIVIAAANDRLFGTLAKTLGHPEWATDPRFTKNADRFKHKVELLASIDGAAYVARGAVNTAGNVARTKRMITRALEAQIAGEGFSFVEILTMCPTGWFIETQEAPAYIDERLAAVHQLGVLRDVSAGTGD